MNRIVLIDVTCRHRRAAPEQLLNWCDPTVPRLINSYLAEPADLANIRRIMVLPFHAEAGITVENNQIRDAFVSRATEAAPLRSGAARPMPRARTTCSTQSLAHGRISTEAMVKLCDRYALDGLFVGSVTAWRPYTPTHLGLRTQLISVHSGSSVWAVDTIFDAVGSHDHQRPASTT